MVVGPRCREPLITDRHGVESCVGHCPTQPQPKALVGFTEVITTDMRRGMYPFMHVGSHNAPARPRGIHFHILWYRPKYIRAISREDI